MDGAIWGRGAGDLKTGIATTIAAAKLLAAAGLRPPAEILFGFVGDEESGEPGTGVSAGIKSLIDEIEAGKLPKPDFAVYVEPTHLNIYTAQMGFVICEISVIGRSAYFGVPELRGETCVATAKRPRGPIRAVPGTTFGVAGTADSFYGIFPTTMAPCSKRY